MLIFGDYKCFPDGRTFPYFAKNGFAIFNFSSYVQNCPQLTNLLPRGVDLSSPDAFDMTYFDYIWNDDYAFIDFMYIINELYKGTSVYIFINHTDFYDQLAESLAELIKQRYGYIAYFINDPDDYDTIINKIDESNFSSIGLMNLDLDRTKFLGILQEKGLFEDDPDNYD